MTDPLLLGRDCYLLVLRELDVCAALALSSCSKAWRAAVLGEDALWAHYCRRDLPPQLWRGGGAPLAAAPALESAHLAAYQRIHRLQLMNEVAWLSQEQAAAAGRGPRAREGHAACAWGRRSMLVSCGFGGGIISDLMLLTPTAPAPGAAQGGPAYRWVQPRCAGRFPVHRYGHTMTRCGPGGEYALVFGGLMAGGYQAALDTVAVLRRKPAAAEAGAAAPGGARREEETSLELRFGGGPQGAPNELLWAQMMMDLFADEDEDSGSELGEDGEDDDDDEQAALDADEFGAAAAAGEESDDEQGWPAVEDHAGGWEASSGSASDEDWLPAESDCSDGEPAEPAGADAPPPASAVAAMARRRSTRGAAAAAAAAGSAGTSAGTSASAGAASTSAAAAAAGGWREEEPGLADQELEWFYPPVAGEPPGSRGYHSAAVSEDGTQVYFFGGIGTHGACNTLAVLDVTTWRFSRPATSGTPPAPRCGHSSVVYGGKLWVVGGGSGRDLLRSGRDLLDVHTLDLATWEWRRVPLPRAPWCAGKCHAAALVGRRLVLFGGSMAACNHLAWLDVEAGRWGAPAAVRGAPPCDRMSATAVLLGDEVVVFGGYTFEFREVGDLWRLRLAPTPADAAAADAAAASTAGRWQGF